MRAAIYLRTSQDRAETGLGLERQEEDCRSLAVERGWDVTEVFADGSISAYGRKLRPGYLRLLRAIEADEVDAVISWHTDRLHREPRELEEYLELCERKHVVTHTARTGELDFSTPSGRMVARILVASASQEMEHRADRTRRAQQQAAEGGAWLGGGRPFGWRLKPIAVHEIEGPMVADASSRVLQGGSLASIVADWNSQGLHTSYGNPWQVTPLRQVLMRARNAGLATWKGEVVGASQFPALVEVSTWQSVCGVLRDPARRRSVSNHPRWLLAGLAFCECGGTMRSATATGRDGSSRSVYRCRVGGSGRHTIKNAKPCDDLVSDRVLEMFRAIRTTRRSPDVARLRKALRDASDAFVVGEITRAEFDRICDRVPVEERRSKFSGDSGATEGGVRLGGLGGEMEWSGASIVEKRAFLRNNVEVVLCKPSPSVARRFDPSSVIVRPIGALAELLE